MEAFLDTNWLFLGYNKIISYLIILYGVFEQKYDWPQKIGNTSMSL